MTNFLAALAIGEESPSDTGTGCRKIDCPPSQVTRAHALAICLASVRAAKTGAACSYVSLARAANMSSRCLTSGLPPSGDISEQAPTLMGMDGVPRWATEVRASPCSRLPRLGGRCQNSDVLSEFGTRGRVGGAKEDEAFKGHPEEGQVESQLLGVGLQMRECRFHLPGKVVVGLFLAHSGGGGGETIGLGHGRPRARARRRRHPRVRRGRREPGRRGCLI